MIPKEPADLVPAASTASVASVAPVKMRERPRRGLPRPSGYDIVNTFSKENRTSAESPKVSPASVASSSPGLFQRNMKFFLSFNKKQRRRSSANSNFSAPYLRRSQSTKEVRSVSHRCSSCNMKSTIAEEESSGAEDNHSVIIENSQKSTSSASIFRNFALKRTRTWGSIVAQLNLRSFKAGQPPTSAEVAEARVRASQNHHLNCGKSTFYTNWRRSQSCRNIERLFSSRR